MKEKKTEKEQMEGVSLLLEKVGDVLNDIKKQMSEGAGFNVFRLCGVDHYETLHSKIIAEFLNPKGSHGQGKLFLDLFCEILGRLGFEGSFSANATVATEVTGYIKDESVGRFDILLEDSSTSSVCIIENKIFASEQPEQLKRYADWLQRERKGWKKFLVFLTLNGREAWSIKEQELYQRLAYVSQDKKPCLREWIDSCLKKIGGEDKPFIQSALKQYKKLIINLATGEQAMNEAIVGVMRGKMECACIIMDNYEQIKKIIEREFFSEIGEQLSLRGLVIQSEDDSWNGLSADDSWNGLSARARDGERGWGWRLREKKKNKREIWLRVFIEAECQVGVFQPDLACKKAERDLVRWCEQNKERLEKGGWNVLEGQYPLCRTVSGVDFPSVEWNARFYDKIETEPKYRDSVKEAIVRNVLLLSEELGRFVQENP